MGYERSTYIKSDSRESRGGIQSLLNPQEPSSFPISSPTTFFKPPWFRYVEEEFTASRETCSLSDFTSFAKMTVWSQREEDVVGFLERMCSNHVNIPVGRTDHALLCSMCVESFRARKAI